MAQIFEETINTRLNHKLTAKQLETAAKKYSLSMVELTMFTKWLNKHFTNINKKQFKILFYFLCIEGTNVFVRDYWPISKFQTNDLNYILNRMSEVYDQPFLAEALKETINNE